MRASRRAREGALALRLVSGGAAPPSKRRRGRGSRTHGPGERTRPPPSAAPTQTGGARGT
eukprot:79816-Prymnesium_polylepis.2